MIYCFECWYRLLSSRYSWYNSYHFFNSLSSQGYDRNSSPWSYCTYAKDPSTGEVVNFYIPF